jgi:hypothetical protein
MACWYVGCGIQTTAGTCNSENDNTLPIKDNTVLYDTVCYNTSNKAKRTAATETATE